MTTQKFYSNSMSYLPIEHKMARNILIELGIKYDDLAPKLKDSPWLKRKVIKTFVKNGFSFEVVEPSGFNLVGLSEIKQATIPSVMYERITQ